MNECMNEFHPHPQSAIFHPPSAPRARAHRRVQPPNSASFQPHPPERSPARTSWVHQQTCTGRALQAGCSVAVILRLMPLPRPTSTCNPPHPDLPDPISAALRLPQRCRRASASASEQPQTAGMIEHTPGGVSTACAASAKLSRKS